MAEQTIAQVAETVAGAGSRLSTHTWRSAAAGNLGGWQVARTLFLLNSLLGAVATPGGTYPNAWNKFVPRPIYTPPHPAVWNELTWPLEYPLALNELSFLLPHFLKEGRGTLDVYFTRVYNPVWTNPDGLSWMEVLTDEQLVGLHVALTPTWSETAFFADYVLPMGLGPERHDLHSYEQYDGQWVAFRQPVLRAARERTRRTRHRHPPDQPRAGVGGERVLDRTVLAHRPRRQPRHPPLPRIQAAPWRETHGRRVLRLDLRTFRARAARGRRRAGLDPA